MNRYYIGLLVLGVFIHGTGTVILCVGSDGRVVIEMAGHRHCHGSVGHGATEKAGHHHFHSSNSHDTDEMVVHHHCEDDHCSDEAAHHTGTFIEDRHTCCGPHVEIPLTPGMTNKSGLEKMPDTKVLSVDIAFTIPDTTQYGSEVRILARASLASTSFYDPLSHIILIV
jgi:hypothetical protein